VKKLERWPNNWGQVTGAITRVSVWDLIVTIDDYPTRVCAGE